MARKQSETIVNLRRFIQHGLGEHVERFRNISDEYELQHQAYYHEPSDAIREHHYGFDEFPYEYCTIRYFSNELSKHLALYTLDFQKHIENIRKNKKFNEQGRKELFTGLYTGLNELSALVNKNALINQYRQPLANFIDLLKSLIVEDATKIIALSFKYRNVNDIFLEKIFNMEINGIWFIDKVETSFPVYKAIMTSKNIYEIDPAYKIQLQCNTRMAAYILRKMESYFSSFYFSNIISSQRFYSKNGVLLKGSNLDVSLKRGGKPPPNKKAIDCFFDQL